MQGSGWCNVAVSVGSSGGRLKLMSCAVNGIAKGSGQGGSKQIAKEGAAREAYYAMGWT